jgi:hypothetical protein
LKKSLGFRVMSPHLLLANLSAIREPNVSQAVT